MLKVAVSISKSMNVYVSNLLLRSAYIEDKLVILLKRPQSGFSVGAKFPSFSPFLPTKRVLYSSFRKKGAEGSEILFSLKKWVPF